MNDSNSMMKKKQQINIALMDINLILTFIQLLSMIVALISVIILARTIQNNKYINQNKPWELAKENKEKFNWVIYGLLDSIHQIAWQIYPFLPTTSQKIAEQLNIKRLLAKNPQNKDSWTNLKPGTKIKTGKPLFPRIT